MFRIAVYLLVFLAGVFLSGCGTRKVYYPQSTMVSKPFPVHSLDSRQKNAYLAAINAVRSQGRRCGSAGYFSAAPSLRWSEALYKAAYEHSNDLKTCATFSHHGSNRPSDWTAKRHNLCRGSTLKERIENNGYKKWKYLAENIERGSSTVDEVMARWVASDRHCANIMNPIFTHVGMAESQKEGSRSDHYWTQTFAAHQ